MMVFLLIFRPDGNWMRFRCETQCLNSSFGSQKLDFGPLPLAVSGNIRAAQTMVGVRVWGTGMGKVFCLW